MSLVYLNHAGTSWPKPKPVHEAVSRVSQASPTEWPLLFQAAHESIASFYGAPTSRILLTPSCTTALALALSDLLWFPGDRVLTSAMEHHALQRHVDKLKTLGVEQIQLPVAADALFDLDALQAELERGKVRLLAFTAACNVTGLLAPMEEAVKLAREYGVLTLVDGAQVAGWQDIRLLDLGVSLFTIAAHKGPQAPWGAGGLYVAEGVPMNCPSAVCDIADDAPRMPGYCDAGSANLAALAGWAAACQWLSSSERAQRLPVAQQLANHLAHGLRSLPGVRIFHDVAPARKMPTVAVSFEGRSATGVAEQLRSSNVIVSGGFQCAPHAHEALGTSESGAVRFSLGPATTASDIAASLAAVEALFS